MQEEGRTDHPHIYQRVRQMWKLRWKSCCRHYCDVKTLPSQPLIPTLVRRESRSLIGPPSLVEGYSISGTAATPISCCSITRSCSANTKLGWTMPAGKSPPVPQSSFLCPGVSAASEPTHISNLDVEEFSSSSASISEPLLRRAREFGFGHIVGWSSLEPKSIKCPKPTVIF